MLLRSVLIAGVVGSLLSGSVLQAQEGDKLQLLVVTGDHA